MKTLRIETKLGAVFILKECTALGMDHIAHSTGVYAINDSDKIVEIN